MSKKGVGIGQVFIFIVAALTFALITIFGYKAITGFLDRGEDVQFYQFKTDWERSIRSIYTEFGAVRLEDFHVPFRYSRICFVDMSAPYDSAPCVRGDLDPLACDSWQENSGYEGSSENVFLNPPAPVKIKVSKIEMEQKFLCLNITSGTFRLHLEGKGSHTFLRKAANTEGAS